MSQSTPAPSDRQPDPTVMPKVIIHVEGGLVQAVYSTEELDIQVYTSISLDTQAKKKSRRPRPSPRPWRRRSEACSRFIDQDSGCAQTSH